MPLRKVQPFDRFSNISENEVKRGEKMKVENFREITIEKYKGIASEEELENIRELSSNLRGLRVLHVNATAFGGGVAELLYTLVPLMRSVGIKADWQVLEAPTEFFNITKKFHNLLQGADLRLTDEEFNLYMKISKENARKLDLDYDIVIIHDPQPAALPQFAKTRGKLIWRCHIDTSTPNKDFWERVKGLLLPYEKLLFHLKEYFPKEFEEKCVEFPPSIDPLSDKNRTLSESEIEKIKKKFSIGDKPLITVVARFDPWKDLFSAIDVYRMVKKDIDVELAIVSAMAHDDPEGWIFFEKVLRYAGMDEDIKFLTNLIGVGAREVNAIQRISTIGLHTATREGFGLVISEIMWKGKPVVARPAGGVKIQVDNNVNGFLAWEKEKLANALLTLLQNQEIMKKMGEKAKEKVRNHFLTTSHLLRYLKVIFSLL